MLSAIDKFLPIRLQGNGRYQGWELGYIKHVLVRDIPKDVKGPQDFPFISVRLARERHCVSPAIGQGCQSRQRALQMLEAMLIRELSKGRCSEIHRIS
jgi:hypothetical protein